MKLVYIISVGAIVSSSTAAKPFAVMDPHGRLAAKPHRNQVLPSTIITGSQTTPSTPAANIALTLPRGGDLGPLTANTAAKVLVGFTILNGYPMWRVTEGAAKSWGISSLSGIQKDLFQCQSANMLLFAIAGGALLHGASSETAIGLFALLAAAELSSYIIDDAPAKYNLPMIGVYFQLATIATIAYANLQNAEWSSTANKVFGVWSVILAAVGLAAPSKMWGDKLNEEALTTLALKNWMSSNVGCAALIAPLVFMNESPEKIVGYSHVPFTLLSVYNVFSEAAKEIMVDDWVRPFFALVMVALTSATLL